MKAAAKAIDNRRMAELAGGVAAAALLAASAVPAKATGINPDDQFWFSVEGSTQWWNHDNNVWAQLLNDTSGDGSPVADYDIDFTNGDFSSFAGALEFGFRPAGSAWDYAALVRIGQLNAGDDAGTSIDDNGDADVNFAFGQCDSSNAHCQVEDQLDFVTVDLVAGYNVSNGGINARGIAGARIGYFDFTRSFDHIVISSESSNNILDIEENATFVGAGPLIGGTVDAPVGRNPNLRIIGKAQTGVMWGSLDYNATSQALFGDFGGSKEFGHNEDDTQTVFFADLALGLGAVVAEGVTIDFGWQASYVSDVVKTVTNVCTKDAGDHPNCMPSDPIHQESTGDVWNHGPYVRMTGAF